jgi:amino acid adenylation domain-containing protein
MPNHGDPKPDFRPDGGETAPLSLAQQRLWVLAQHEGGANEAYNEPMAFDLRGRLDREVLGHALDALAARHESLRTRLVMRGDSPCQLVDPPETGLPFAIEDLTGCPDAVERLAAIRHDEHARPFVLDGQLLARSRLVVLGPDHHVLLLTIHHIIFDGWSRNIVLRELGLIYSALLRHEPIPLLELSWQYIGYARWQREWMAGEEPAGHAAYWTETLGSAPAMLDLPIDRPRPAQQDFRGGRVPVHIDRQLTDSLRQLATRCDVTLYSTILTGWAVVLSLLSGQDDIVIGAPTANRRRGDVGRLVGFFVNTLALRVDLSGVPTVENLLRQTGRMLRDGLEHVDLPFEQVVELVNPPRSASHTPLFQTMFAWVPSMRGLLKLPDVKVTPLDVPYAPAKFDLALALADEHDRIVGDLDFATALFDRPTVERYARYLVRVLSAMAQQPEGSVSDLTLLDADEQRELLAHWSSGGPSAEPPQGRAAGLVERFEAQARVRPDQDALVHETGRLDYATLERRANRLAHALIGRGVRPGQVVGLHAGRTAELVVGVLGILKAGAAYLPLDPGQPFQRLAGLVADAAPALVLTDIATSCPEPAGCLGLPDAGRDTASPNLGAADPARRWERLTTVEAEAERDDAPTIPDDPSRLAYVIYTSGSTGRPKGVAVTHASVVNLLDYWREVMGEAPGEAASAWSSIGFDASVHEILMPLTTGAVLHLVPDTLRGDPEALMEWLREHRVTQAFLPPSYVTWIDEDPAGRLAGLSLRRLLTGVESLPESSLHRMREVLPDLRICYGYGPTEATLYTTAYTEPGPRERQCPIGRPIRGTRLYLLDGRMRPVPPGVAGEVYVGGASLARGYLHRPDLTRERFVADPFVPGELVYRTGDRARWLPDGNAEYVGRKDDQVKLRGFRIEPGEVEAALLALPGVREAAVLADREAPGGPRLVAGVGLGDAPPRSAREWRTALARRLPDYMIPAVFAQFPRLPLNRSGKVDRTAVLAAAATTATASINTLAPRDHVEMALYRIWRRLLLHPAIGVNDDFFAAGGTSISAIKVAHAIREEFGETLPVRDILLHPTIEALAARLREGTSHGPVRPGENSLVELRAGDGQRRVVCVHPAGGTAFCYLPLAAALPEGVGVVGLQAPGIDPGESTLPSVEAMAEQYLRLVDPRPGESLVLCGLSYGGLVAHEMGRLLAADGRHHLSVVLLDTHGTEDIAQRAAIGPVDATEFREKLVRFNGMYPGIDDDQIARYLHVYNHHRATARDYDVPASPSRTVLVQATAPQPGHESDQGEEAARQRAFWERRAGGGLVVEPVACGHWDLLESDELPQIAKIITVELDRLAETGTPHRGRTPHSTDHYIEGQA